MKMRFWQKTYFFTLMLFLLFFNIGILSLTAYTFRRSIASTEAEAAAEQAYIVKSLERDLADFFLLNLTADPALLMQSYGAYYEKSGIFLAFETTEGAVLYSNFSEDYHIPADTLSHVSFHGQRYILIASPVYEGRYVMYFAKDISALEREFRTLAAACIAAAFLISALLAVCLYLILKKLSTPLEALQKTTESIEAGDFSVRAAETGSDEFTLLAKSFNSMLARIRDQMKLLEDNAQKKQMLVDDLAHELRTPLTSIHGYAEFLEKASASEEQRIMAAKYILSESERLQRISELLLDGAFLAQNPPAMQPVELSGILLDTAEKLQMKAKSCGVTLTCQGSPLTVSGNPTLLSMVCYNLCENAIKACSKGGSVRLSCAGTGSVTIEDNGKGMTAEQLSHITEPFYRTDKSRSRADGGAGLGLTLCRQITELHHADMQFASQPGRGTKVTILFTIHSD